MSSTTVAADLRMLMILLALSVAHVAGMSVVAVVWSL